MQTPLAKEMLQSQWNSQILPKLITQSKHLGIIPDAFPEVVQESCYFLVRWPNCHWFGTYGHDVPSSGVRWRGGGGGEWMVNELLLFVYSPDVTGGLLSVLRAFIPQRLGLVSRKKEFILFC